MIYLIIKQTDRRLIWTIIPISAFLYSPLTSSGYFSIALLAWYFPMLGITAIIYFFNKKIINSKLFASGIFFAVFSTFSILLGVISWITGIVMLAKSISEKKIENKKWILLWASSIIITGFIYMNLTSGLSEPTSLDLLFSSTGLIFIANFLSSSFRLKYELLMIIVGSLSIIVSFVYVLYFIKKDSLKQYFPWFALLFTAFSGSIITALGRAQLDNHLGNEPYYSTISQLFQIGLIVLTGKIILDFKLNNSKTIKRKIILTMLILLLVSQMIILIPSYYSGWERGQYYFDEKTEFVNCFSLSPQIDCLEKYPTYPDNYLPMINHLIENKLSIFNESYLFNESEYLQKFSSLNDISNKKLINNSVSINDERIKNNQTYDLTQNLIKIDGWFSGESNSIPETLILLVDDEPLLENHDFKFTKNNTELTNQVTVNWSIFFLSGYIESGCHLIHFEGIIDDEKILLDNQFTLCK